MNPEHDNTNEVCGHCINFRVCLARNPDKKGTDKICDNYQHDDDAYREGRTILDLDALDDDRYLHRANQHIRESEQHRQFRIDTQGYRFTKRSPKK